jgi:hypothetical protein
MSEAGSDGHAIETMQVEERRFEPSPEFRAQANAQPDIYDRGFDEFWTKVDAAIYNNAGSRLWCG